MKGDVQAVSSVSVLGSRRTGVVVVDEGRDEGGVQAVSSVLVL